MPPLPLGGKGGIVIIVLNNDYTIEAARFATDWFSLTGIAADAIMEENPSLEQERTDLMKANLTRRLLALVLSVAAVLALAGCSSQENAPASSASPSSQVQETSSASSQPDSTQSEPSQEPEEEPAPAAQTAVLYIGTEDNFQSVEAPYTGTLTPAFLVDAIAQETGWNLDLADEITQGKGGMTVDFASTSSIVTGPPETQKDAYRVSDQGELVETILDSIAYTFQQNFVDSQLGDPSSLEVYFSLNGGDITVNGITFDFTQPYEIQD